MLVVLLCTPALAAAQAPAKDDKLDLVIKGELKAGDPKDKVTKQPSKVHGVKLRGGQAYVITLDAVDKGLDPYLRVEDSAGRELARDDDSGGKLNAKLLFLPPKDGAYRVIATAYDGTGSYVLRVCVAGKNDIVAAEATRLEQKAKELNAAGVRAYQGGKVADAIMLCQQALDIVRALNPKKKHPNGHLDLARSISNVANLHQAAGDYDNAEPLFREALLMCRQLFPKEKYANGHPDLARSINDLGFLHTTAGDYGKTEPLYREALLMRRQLFSKEKYPNGHPDLVQSIVNLGFLHQAAGDYGKAEPLLREGLLMCRQLFPKEEHPNGHLSLAQSINSLGHLHHATGDYSKAEPLFREALLMCRQLFPKEKYANGHPELASIINNLGFLHQAAGDYGKAEPLFSEALLMTRQLFPKEKYPNGHPNLASIINNLGFLHQAAGDYGKAEPLYREALLMRRQLFRKEKYPNGHPNLAGSIRNLGILHHTAGNYGKAEPLFREALQMDRRQLRQYAELAAEAESLNFAGRQPLARDAFLSNQRHQPVDPTVYDTLWDGRAVLTRLQERRHRDLMASQDKQTAALAHELRLTRMSLARLLLNPGRDATAHRQLVDRLTETNEDLEKRIATQLKLTLLKPATAGTTVQQFSAALPASAAFVDLIRYTYFEYDPKVPGRKGEKRTPHYVAFVVRKGQPVAQIELKEAAPIEEAWSAWHKTIVDSKFDRKAERAAAAAFAKRVWAPIRAALPADCRTVYLTPDGALSQVPWAALPGRKPDTVLLEDHALCLVPHGPWLLERLEEKAVPRASDTLLAYGGVAYDQMPEAVIKEESVRGIGSAGTKHGAWANLPGTAREQQAILDLASKALKAKPIARSGRAASTLQLMEDLPRARYAHIATHGFFADPEFRSALQVDPKLFEHRGFGERRTAGARSPLVLSGLVLAGANREGADAAPDRGIITAEGLISLRMEDLELAVLSACETGLGEAGGGEGVFGLQRAFHVAGCKNVIASLWKVNDAATAALMNKFYHEMWINNKTPAEALRLAQLTIYRNPDLIPALAGDRGQERLNKAVRQPATGAAAGSRADTKLWAAFVLSGLGK